MRGGTGKHVQTKKDSFDLLLEKYFSIQSHELFVSW
jgi:hypothetical protein